MTYRDVGESRHRIVHRDEAFVEIRAIDVGKIRIQLLQRPEIGRLHMGINIARAVSHGIDPRVAVEDDLHLHARNFWHPAPPMHVAREEHRLVMTPALQHVGTGSDRMLPKRGKTLLRRRNSGEDRPAATLARAVERRAVRPVHAPPQDDAPMQMIRRRRPRGSKPRLQRKVRRQLRERFEVEEIKRGSRLGVDVERIERPGI